MSSSFAHPQELTPRGDTVGVCSTLQGVSPLPGAVTTPSMRPVQQLTQRRQVATVFVQLLSAAVRGGT